MMIDRDLTPQLRKAARQFPAVTLTGPRQSGKSTLCQAIFPKLPYASLEAPDIRAFAIDDPRGFLAQFPKGSDVVVAYGGEVAQRRSDAKLIPWADLHDASWIA